MAGVREVRGEAVKRSRSIALSPARGPAWSRSVWIPGEFFPTLSKNRAHLIVRINGRPRIATTLAYKSTCQAVANICRNALRGAEVRQAKLWLSMHVYKTDHRGDAANLLDGVLDSLQIASGLNDRWYAIGGIDWTVEETEPGIELKIWQEGDEV
jgi:hypothetical protein